MKKIAFIGIDGSGKSTLISYTKAKLEEKGFSIGVVFMGWKNFYNPLLRIFSKKHKKSNIQNRLKRYRERSWLFYAAYYTELLTRYLKIIFSNKDFILIDRYFFDELAFSGKKFNFLKSLTPKPDITFILKPSQQSLEKRGEKFEKQELENYYSQFEKLKQFFKIIEIDSSKKPELLFKEIKTTLNKSL